MIDSPNATYEVPLTAWHAELSEEECRRAQLCLESGGVLLFPGLAFTLTNEERPLLDHPDPTEGRVKNVSYDPANDSLRGTILEGEERETARAMLARYSACARELILKICPAYAAHLITKRASWRPVEIEGRVPLSWRKDDRLIHVDAFPSTPTGGHRLLRVFTNIHPADRARVWVIGEEFQAVVQRFHAKVPAYSAVVAYLLSMFHLTRGLRTSYDHTMLAIHDLMKGDPQYQQSVPKTRLELRPGTTWVTFTDQCSHSALAGQHALEQTFDLDPEGLLYPELSPLRVLEKYAETNP